MYDYGYSYGYGLIGGNTYNPLINYDWSTTTTSGLRYLKDVGSTPTYNASMYFGRGAYLNGVDQTITVPINTTIQTALKRVNGVVTINETSQTLTDYVISGLGVHKDYYLFTRLLTQSEKDSYTNTPELFYAMAQADNTCVLNMPMCETDGYVRNMKSYSEGSELVTNISMNYSGSGTVLFEDLGNQRVRVRCTTIGTSAQALMIVIPTSIQSNTTYLSNIDVITNTGTCFFTYPNKSPVLFPVSTTMVTGKSYPIIYTTTFGNPSTSIYIDDRNLFDITFDISIKKLSGAYPITNYTTSVRDNAKNLQYGLQTCKFVRDSLGVIQSPSDYLECDGGGYGNTGWKPSVSEDWTIELIQNDKSTSLQTIGTGTSIPNVFIGRNGSYVVSKIGNIDMAAITNLLINHIVVTFNAESKSTNFYVNNQLSSGGNIVTNTSWVNSFSLGVNIQKTFPSSAVFRTFKVHKKVLTQAEITSNYNSYVAKGLLS